MPHVWGSRSCSFLPVGAGPPPMLLQVTSTGPGPTGPTPTCPPNRCAQILPLLILSASVCPSAPLEPVPTTLASGSLRPRVCSRAWLQRHPCPHVVLTFGLIHIRLALAGWGLQAGRLGGGLAQGTLFRLLCAPEVQPCPLPPHIPHPGLRNPRNHWAQDQPRLDISTLWRNRKVHFPDPRSGLSELQGRGVGEARPLLGMHACGRSRLPFPGPGHRELPFPAALGSHRGPGPGVAPDTFRA